MTLTDEQLATFKSNGFIVLRGFVDASRCEAILEVAKRHLTHMIQPLETEEGYTEGSKEKRTEVTDYSSDIESQKVVRRLRQVYQRDEMFKAWMEDEKIRPILQQILDDQVVLTTAHHNSIMTKVPYVSSPTSWHQDRRYWRYSDDNLVSVWLALDEEYSQNGVLEFIVGSHKMKFTSEQFDEKEYFSEDHVLNKEILKAKVSTELQKGDVVIFHSLLLHRANRNSTSNTKLSFVYTVKGRKTVALSGSRSAQFPEIMMPKI